MNRLFLLFFVMLAQLAHSEDCENVITRERAIQIADEIIKPDSGAYKMRIFSAKCYKNDEKIPGVWFVGYECILPEGLWVPGCGTTVSITNEEMPAVNGKKGITKQ